MLDWRVGQKARSFRVWATVVGSRVVGGRWRKDEPHPKLTFDLPRVPAKGIASGASFKKSAGWNAAKAFQITAKSSAQGAERRRQCVLSRANGARRGPRDIPAQPGSSCW